MWELCEDKQTDFMIRLIGLKCFRNGDQMTWMETEKEKPAMFRNNKDLLVYKIEYLNRHLEKAVKYLGFNMVEHTITYLFMDDGHVSTSTYKEVEDEIKGVNNYTSKNKYSNDFDGDPNEDITF